MSEIPPETPKEPVEEGLEPVMSSEPEPAETLPAPKPESAFRRFVRKVIRWTLFVFVIFGLGMIAALVLWYLPMRNTANAHLQALEAANQQISELKEQVSSQTALEKEYQAALERLKTAGIVKLVQSLQVEIASARIALYQNNIEAAQSALANAEQLIAELKRQAAKDQQTAIADLQTRLTLAKSELKDNAYAAQSDLDVLWRGLIDLLMALDRAKP